MKVVLRTDIQGVGRRGDVVEVAGGFARNYLLPEGRAIIASPGVDGQAASMRRARDLREAKDRAGAEAQAAVLSGATITVTARAGAAGRLFGSVSANEIAEAVQGQKGIELDRKHIHLDEPIKAVGSHELIVELFADVKASFTVEVTAAS